MFSMMVVYIGSIGDRCAVYLDCSFSACMNFLHDFIILLRWSRWTVAWTYKVSFCRFDVKAQE
jgi:hypothetical protein